VKPEEGLRHSIRLAGESVQAGGGPFGAIVVQAGKVVGAGRNRVTEMRDPTAHAEILAIREACETLSTHRLEGCILYASSEPCLMCLGAIYWARLTEVFFANERSEAAEAGFDDAFIYDEIDRPPADRRIRVHRVNVLGADEPFRLWRARADREEY
jgi:tRNA(Arg) A34 adenosine deaminase TadA